MSYKPLVVSGAVQNYHWGTKGINSFVARLLDNVDPGLPYAELWFGTHHKAPSKVKGSDQNLREIVLQDVKGYLGGPVADRFNNELPFLFKALSVARPLSIQLHPTKDQAEKLNSNLPQHYPDANHKPEVAIAMSQFELLYGIKSIEKLQSTFKSFPELNLMIGKELVENVMSASPDDTALQRVLLEKFYAVEQSALCRVCALIKERIERQQNKNEDEILFFTLAKLGFESDPGIFVALMMNKLILQPGQAVFLDANTLHAYLKGDCIECMANSDNVVRAGLTPKFQDVETLLDIINIESEHSPILNPAKKEKCVRFNPPIDEFAVDLFTNYSGEYPRNENMHLELCVLIEGELWLEDEKVLLEAGDGLFIPKLSQFRGEFTNARFARVFVPEISS